jgi:pentatricopeptide repeat protein
MTIFDTFRLRGAPLSRKTYHAALSACKKGGLAERAIEILDIMSQKGTMPNLESCNHAITACENGTSWDGARNVLTRMQKEWDVAPDAVSFQHAMALANSVGKWREALVLFDYMQQLSVTPNYKCNNEAIRACGIGGQWEKAQTYVNAVRQRGDKPSGMAYTAVLRCCADAGRFSECVQLATRLWEVCIRGLRPWGDATASSMMENQGAQTHSALAFDAVA